MASYQTKLSVYQSSGTPGYGPVDQNDVTGKTTQFVAGNQGDKWVYHNIKGGEFGWTVTSRYLTLNYKKAKGDFVSFKVKNTSPRLGYWRDWVVDIYDPSRSWQIDGGNYGRLPNYTDYVQNLDIMDQADFYGSAYSPWTSGQVGIAVNMEQFGNDIVIPNGRGQDYHLSGGYAGRYARTFDYAPVFVTVQNGVDSVVGGYSSDIIISKPLDYKAALDKFEAKFNNAEDNSFGGTKLFVGGSDDDFLSGGRDSDLLVGDRLNGYELFLNREALKSNIPAQLQGNRKRLLNYQPTDFNKTQFLPDVRRGIGKEIQAGVIRYLRPGSDVLHGQAGDDYIYGDSTEDDSKELYNYRKHFTDQNGNDFTFKPQNLPSDKSKWSALRIGLDYIDGGSGNDEIHAGYGSDAIIGGKGSDIIFLGDQIGANGYEPLWGPKVAWGSAKGDKEDASPDLFVLGDLKMTEDDINAEAVAYDAQRKAENQVQSAWADALSNLFTTVGSLATGGMTDLALSIISLFKVDKSDDAKQASQTLKDLDTASIIRDFGKRDLLAIKIRNKESLFARKQSIASKYSDSDNPLVASGVDGEGYVFTVKPDAGSSYTRCILEGYTGKLYQVASTRQDENGKTVVKIAGKTLSEQEVKTYFGAGFSVSDGDYLLLGGSDFSKCPVWASTSNVMSNGGK